MIDPSSLFSINIFSVVIKVLFLILLGIYILFAIILLNKTRSLGRIVFIAVSSITLLLQGIALFHLIASILLFLIALAIL